jgi:hypothetical protein
MVNNTTDHDKTRHIIVQPTRIEFHGSSSKTAQGGELADYRSSEGKSVSIPYRGPVENTLKHILGGMFVPAAPMLAQTS